ncbi:MAG: DUF5615 family PIN-like protein [Planctomycetales bacterium]|nr:DUF5615 family PIN-like protein [Planctomycetales bacterium]MCA9207919.1 DUF5615 family PIN-like protein [Planctomycetales bacterium]MCA9225505.1 DUF5615 family PIN-like protein [Planctomycetales bacterium]
MRFLVDECTGPGVAKWLSQQYEVFSVWDENPGMTDDQILDKSTNENWVIITNDKDFGEMVYRERRPHAGVVLLRLQDERTAKKQAVLQALLSSYNDRLPGAFVVVTETQVRFGTNN